MDDETYRNLVIFLLITLIGLYLYDLTYVRCNTITNSEKNKTSVKSVKTIKTIKKQNITPPVICENNICYIDKKNKNKYKEEEIKSIGDINNNSLDDIESVVKKISNI
jgi:hypothetical protein